MAGYSVPNMLYVFAAITLLFYSGVRGQNTSCPDSCTCLHGTAIIDCSRARYSTLPAIPGNVEVLLMDNNPLGTIPAKALANLTKLGQLSLQNCSLNSIHPQAFYGLDSLCMLTLSKNKLKELPSEFVTAKGTLEHLLLASNLMTLDSLAPALSGLAGLRVLDISDNAIDRESELPEEFSDLHSLMKLKMEYVHVNMSAWYFSPLENISVEHLSLAMCKISNVSALAMIPLTKLKVLDMKHAVISASDAKNLVHGLSNATDLETLYMNDIFNKPHSIISKHLFQPLVHVSVKNLTFSGNYYAFDGFLHKTFKPFHSLKTLDLAYCGLYSIKNDAFQSLRKLKVLDLSGNLLTCFRKEECGFLNPPLAHHNLDSLEFLDLSWNNLQTDSPHLTFRGGVFKNLLSLNLRGNKIITLKKGIFVNVDTLQHLDISGNPLSLVQENWLQGMRSLYSLFINASFPLTRIEARVFHGAPVLQYLHMGQCNIEYIHPLAFQGLKTLQTVYLRDNNLENTDDSMRGVIFDTLTVWKVDLGHNFLTTIPDLVTSQPNLTNLYLDYNQITDTAALVNLPNLEKLDLSFNSITKMPHSVFNHCSKLKVASLQGNPFCCDCDFDNLGQVINKTNVSIVMKENHLCQTPGSQHGKSIFLFRPSHWECKSKYVAIPFLCILVTLFVGACALMLRRCGCQSPHIECSRDLDCCTNCYFPLKQSTETNDMTEDLSRL